MSPPGSWIASTKSEARLRKRRGRWPRRFYRLSAEHHKISVRARRRSRALARFRDCLRHGEPVDAGRLAFRTCSGNRRSDQNDPHFRFSAEQDRFSFYHPGKRFATHPGAAGLHRAAADYQLSEIPQVKVDQRLFEERYYFRKIEILRFAGV